MTTSVRLHRRTCVFERQDVGIHDIYVRWGGDTIQLAPPFIVEKSEIDR